MVLGAFVASLLVFVAIGAWSSRESDGSTEDYLVAGRHIPPWLTALSSVATNNSGFMFIGMIGFTYRDGVSAAWMAVAWILGDMLAWWFVHPRVRRHAEAIDAVSVPTLLATDTDGSVQRPVAMVTAAMTFLFLGGYAAAQLQAGGTALHTLFGWPLEVGAVLGAVIVVIYCFSGGLRASIWTDAAQSVVMFVAMLALLGYAGAAIGGPSALMDALTAQDPSLTQPWPVDPWTAGPLYMLGFIAGGFGAVGQPHILIRTMALDNADHIASARRTYFLWFIPFYAMGIAVALYARALVPELAVAPAGLSGEAAQNAVVQATEGALPALSIALLPDLWVGITLAGLFAATMSTADSQILACSAAVTEDLLPERPTSVWAPKLATLAVAALALGIALFANDGVFALVLGAWAILGAGFIPVLLVRLAGRPLDTSTALAMLAAGVGTVWIWPHVPGGSVVYKLLPGILVPIVLYWARRTVLPPSAGAEDRFPSPSGGA